MGQVLEVKSIDKKIEYPKVSNAYIFTVKYRKKLSKNEFHNPGVARIIFESDNKIINLLFMDLLISIDKDEKIIVRTMNPWAQIIQNKPYYSLADLKRAQQLFIIYRTKGIETLEPDEIFEYSWAKDIMEMAKVQNIKVPFHIGGGF